MSAVNPISYVGVNAVDAEFLVADGESRVNSIKLYTYKWWSPLSGLAIFYIRTSTTNDSGKHLLLTPSGQEIFPTQVTGNSDGWNTEQIVFKVSASRPYIQFVVCPMCASTEDSITLEGTNYAINHVAMGDVPLEGVATLDGASRLFTPEETLEVIQFPVNPPR